MKREEILEAARKCVCGEREQDYGSPEDNFATIAALWSTYLNGCKGNIMFGRAYENIFLRSCDVAAMMALLKIARIAGGGASADSWIDLAGYAACGGELQIKGEGKP